MISFEENDSQKKYDFIRKLVTSDSNDLPFLVDGKSTTIFLSNLNPNQKLDNSTFQKPNQFEFFSINLKQNYSCPKITQKRTVQFLNRDLIDNEQNKNNEQNITQPLSTDMKTKLRSAHGSLMVVGWVLFITFGGFVARTKFKFWYQIHLISQIMGLICISIAFGIIVNSVNSSSYFKTLHGTFGAIIIFLAFIQSVLATLIHFLRDNIGENLPKVHSWLGRAIWLTALFNIVLGFRQYGIMPLEVQGAPFWGIYLTWLVLIVFGSNVYMTWHEWNEKKNAAQIEIQAKVINEADPYDIYTATHYDSNAINELERVVRDPPNFLEILFSYKILTFFLILHLVFSLTLALLFITLSNNPSIPPFEYCPSCVETSFGFSNFTIPFDVPRSSCSSNTSCFMCVGFSLTEFPTSHIVEFNINLTNEFVADLSIFQIPYDTSNLGYYPCLDSMQYSLFVYGWSFGMNQTFSLPLNAGIRIGQYSDINYLVLQFHYQFSTPLLQPFVETSSLSFKSSTSLRTYDVGVLPIGIFTPTISIPPQMNQYELSGECSSDKTSLMSFPLHVFSSSMYARKYANFVWIEQIRAASLVNVLTNSLNYSDYLPTLMMSNIDSDIQPGDLLRTFCIYNTTDTDNYIFGGYSANSEQCWAFLSYYPKVDAFSCYSSARIWKNIHLPSMNNSN